MSECSPSPTEGDTVWRRLMQDSLPGIVWCTDADLRIVSCQGSGSALGGCCAEELRRTTLFEIFRTTRHDFPPIAAHLQALDGMECPILFTLAATTYRGQVAPLRPTDKVRGCVMVALDQPSLDARCQSIADTAVDLILFMDTDGTIEDVNRSATGLPREQVIGSSVFSFVPPDAHDSLQQAIDSVLRTGDVATLDVKFSRRFGEPSWQSLRIGPIHYRDRTTGLVLLATDTTQRRQAMAKLRAEEKLLRDLLELQDRERRMVALEIHDGFIQDVVGARMILQGVQQALGSIDPAIRVRMESAISLMARAVNDGRRLISELRPMIIDEMGIVDALEYVISEEEARGDIRISFTHRIDRERLPPLLQATIFRITRESLTNARRHGSATHVEIRLTQIGPQFLVLEIQDNGTGFDVDAVPPDRYGLTGIQERARLFGGGATIESGPNLGTRITVKLAIEPPPDADGHRPSWAWTT